MISFSGRKGKGRVSIPARGHGNPNYHLVCGLVSGGWEVGRGVCGEDLEDGINRA